MLFLVVDDDVLSRELLTLLLEAEGYEVESAGSGEQALERVAIETRPTPGVILSDIQMPGLAGHDLADALRSALRNRKTLLLAMSGSQPKDAAIAAFDGFLLKPFSLSELQTMVSKRGGSGCEVERAGVGESDALDAAPPLADGLEAAALDEEIYTKLGELMPAEQLGQMYAMCADDARKRIARMRSLSQIGDDAQYRAEAHAVKGGCGMIGAKEIYELAALAERDGLAADGSVAGTTSVTARLAQMSLACDRLERILTERTRE